MQLFATRFVDVHPHTAWCPRPGCCASVLLRIPSSMPSEAGEGAGDVDRLGSALTSGRGLGVACGRCDTRFCFECGRSPPHEPASCAQVGGWYYRAFMLCQCPPNRGHPTVTMLFWFQVQQWEDLQLRLKKEDVAGSEAWLRRNTKPCPKCGCLVFYQFSQFFQGWIELRP